MLKWAIFFSILYLAKKEFFFFPLLKGAIIGEGLLYHFWFLTGLVILYLFFIFLTLLFSFFRINFRELASSNFFICFFFLVSTIAFCVNILLKKYFGLEIRDVIPAPIRIIDNGFYFFMGIYIYDKLNGKGQKKISNKSSYRNNFIIYTGIIVVCYLSMILFSDFTGILWASSYYTFPLVAVAVFFFFILFMTFPLNISDKMHEIFLTSTGIWVLHPFVLRVILKIFTFFGIETNLLISGIIFLFTIISSITLSLIAKRMKFINRMITL